MNWDNFFFILNELVYPMVAILFFAGLVGLISGIWQLHARSSDRPVPWYNYPTILNAIGAMFFASFGGCLVTGIHASNGVLKLLFYIAAFACGGLYLLCLLRARRFAALLPPKRKRLKRAQPKG